MYEIQSHDVRAPIPGRAHWTSPDAQRGFAPPETPPRGLDSIMGANAMRIFFWSALITVLIGASGLSFGEDFLGAPVMPGGKEVSQSGERLHKTYDVSYEKAVEFYRDALKGEKDVKFRDRGDHMLIEEYSNRPWHSIRIIKAAEGRCEIAFLKDNWTWILGTLTLRFFGVFAVLFVLYVALEIAGAIISKLLKMQEQKA
jgi:hypothetical protein